MAAVEVGEPAQAQVEAVVEAAQAQERVQVDPAAEAVARAEDLAVGAGEPAQGQAEAVVEAV